MEEDVAKQFPKMPQGVESTFDSVAMSNRLEPGQLSGFYAEGTTVRYIHDGGPEFGTCEQVICHGGFTRNLDGEVGVSGEEAAMFVAWVLNAGLDQFRSQQK